MPDNIRHYIDGTWIDSDMGPRINVVNPATEKVVGSVANGDQAVVDAAVAAARRAFGQFQRSDRQFRLDLLDRIMAGFEARKPDLVTATTAEIGAPTWLAEQAHVSVALGHLAIARQSLAEYEFDSRTGNILIAREAIGVVGLITPWNWPLGQIAAKIGPALAAGCTIILKPSEFAPTVATIVAEIMDAAGVPRGVFNLVHGDGPNAGAALASHVDVDMVSFTGSTAGGVAVAHAAADTVKRVHQELGGKSPNILLPSADFQKSITESLDFLMMNSGQSCNAPTRLLVPQDRMKDAEAIAAEHLATKQPGMPETNPPLGPVISRRQFDRVQALIQAGIDEGAKLVVGGPGRPKGLAHGFFVRPTVFSEVDNGMTVAQEEIFGPVLVIIGYRDLADAISIANDTPYGLAAYVQGDAEEALKVGQSISAGQVIMNRVLPELSAPFGGYKRSGNGREWGPKAIEEFLEVKSLVSAA